MFRTGFALFTGLILLCGSACQADGPLLSAPVDESNSRGLPDASADTTTSNADPLVGDTGIPTADPTMGSPSSAGSTTQADKARVQKALMDRWNAAVGEPDTSIDFHWTEFERFPHPTYKGGTAEGYQVFASILLAFFRQGDNFAFMAQNRLFDLRIVYAFDSGAIGLATSFRSLARSFASPDGFGNVPLATRQSLQEFVVRMEAEGS
jgi:hypothetical protein